MTKQEFENLAGVVTDETFEAVNTVYTFHPSIDNVKGKAQIADLYKTFGLRIILDMVPTSVKARAYEEDIRKKMVEVEHLKAGLEALQKGDGGMPC